MALRVTAYGGVGDEEFGELGGVQILFHDEELNTKFMLDMGQRPDHMNDYYGFPYKAKPYRALPISEFLGSYPPLRGLYRHDYLARMGEVPGEVPVDGLLITHEHFDHIGGLPLIRHDLPTYINEMSLIQMYIWQNLSGGTINEFVDIYDRFSLGKSVSGKEKFLKGEESRLERNIIRYKPGTPFKIGNIEFMAYRVDHSVPGSCGFIANTSIGKIGISGDIRYRGRRTEYTKAYLKECVDQKVKYMLLEGSLLHFPHEGTEADVTEAVAKETKHAALATISYPIRDFDRLTSLYYAAKQNKRMLVITMDQAVYLKAYNGVDGFPKLDWKYIGVYVPPMGKGLIDDPRYSQELVFEDYKYWQRPFLEKTRWIEHDSGIQRVSIQDIKQNQDKFLVSMNGNGSAMLDFYEYVRPKPTSKHIRSTPQGWTKAMDAEDDKKRNVLEDFGMYKKGVQTPDYFEPKVMHDITQIHVTGHMNKRELKETLDMFDPSVTTFFPYHTLQFKLYTSLLPHNNFVTPIRAKEMILK